MASQIPLDSVRNMETPDKIAQLFKDLGYNVVGEAQPLDAEALELPFRSQEALLDAYLIANHRKGNEWLQVLLLELQDDEWASPSIASGRMKSIAKSLCSRPSDFLLVGVNPNYEWIMLVNPRKESSDGVTFKVGIRKLLIDRTNPTAYDRDRLDAITANGLSPRQIYQKQCEAFDVEKLTKKFYAEYRTLFEQVQQVVLAHNPSSYFEDADRLHQFSQRLLGRIMFLYFLQKKEFLAGDRKFLTKAYKVMRPDHEDCDYYAEVLEPLFFETLNHQRPNFESQWGKIPYLNGGLFDRDYGPGIKDAAGRQTPETIVLPNSLFDPGDSQSILGFFNSYNFTISENVAGDEDVAVDPEMLGKVFENMLAAEERGKSGTFYTPRGIVQFMCTEVLSRYLADASGMTPEAIRELMELDADTPDKDFNDRLTREQTRNIKKALDTLKVLDPAVGSGAFPLGMMQTILAVRQAVARREGMTVQRGSLALSQWKRDIIANNLYGVDIKPGAIEIAKLRMWLSLVVDIPEIDDVEPLPNLDYKLMCGDSLISTIHGETIIPDPTKEQQGMLAVTPIQQAIQPLLDLQHQYFSAQTEERHALRSKILEAEANIFKVAVADRVQYLKGQQREVDRKIRLKSTKALEKQKAELVAKLTDLEKFAAEVEGGDRSLNFFNYHLHFRDVFDEKGGFDVVVGNPPYVKEYEGKHLFDGLRDKKIYQGKMDLWYLFASEGLDLLRNNGILSFIAQNNWVTSSGASKFRNKILSVAKIEMLLDFCNYMIFDTASIQTMVMLFQKSDKEKEYNFDYRRINARNADFTDVVNLMNKLQNNKVELITPLINREKLINQLLTFSSNQLDLILLKIREKQNFYLSENEVGQGIVPNPDKLSANSLTKIPLEKINKYLIKAGEGVFVVNKGVFPSLSPSEQKYLKPLYEPSDVEKYCLCYEPRLEIIYIAKDGNFCAEKAKTLINHLSKYREVMDERRENKQGKREFYHLHWPRENRFFEQGEKILCVRKCQNPTFTYTDREAFVMMSFNIIKSEKINLKFLTAILNSTMVKFWLKHKGKMQGSIFQIDKEPLLNIPIYVPNEKEQKKIINLVDQILTAKQSNLDADTSQLEAEIDKLVYQLYDLTEEEIAIVENTR